MSQITQNSMKKISIDKVVLNMGVGKSGDPIEIGKKTLEQITGKKPKIWSELHVFGEMVVIKDHASKIKEKLDKSYQKVLFQEIGKFFLWKL